MAPSYETSVGRVGFFNAGVMPLLVDSFLHLALVIRDPSPPCARSWWLFLLWSSDESRSLCRVFGCAFLKRDADLSSLVQYALLPRVCDFVVFLPRSRPMWSSSKIRPLYTSLVQ